jgi:hypothetical protein
MEGTMTDVFFTQAEAKQKLRRKVRTIAELPPVPAGTEGVVVKVVRSKKEDWRVRIEWRIKPGASLMDPADLSLLGEEKAVFSDLSKSAYVELVEEYG